MMSQAIRSEPSLEQPAAVYFYSAVELPDFQTGLMKELTAQGWPAQQYFSVSQLDYRKANTPAQRLRARAQAYLGYPTRLAARFLRKQGSIGVVSTNTFFAPWLAERAGRYTGVPVVHWVFDLFPDALVVGGKLRSGSISEWLLRTCVRATLNGAAANVFLGEHLRSYAEERFGTIPRSHVIPVGCDATPFRNDQPAARHPRQVKVLYCGNLGRMHDINTFVAIARDGLPPGLAFDFRGSGASYRLLKDQLGTAVSEEVRFDGHIPGSAWVTAMLDADVALVTVKSGAEAVVMPSKTYSALAAGQAILAICPRTSDLADTVLAHDCGWVVEPGDCNGLRNTLNAIVCDPAELLRRRINAWHAGHEVYDQRVLVKRWIDLFTSIRSSQ